MCDLAPDPVDVTDLQFRARPTIRVAQNALKSELGDRQGWAFQALAVANKFAKVFAASDSSVVVLDLAEVEAANGGEIPWDQVGKARSIPLPATPTHVALSSDELTLAVCVPINHQPMLYFFDVRSLSQSDPIRPFTEALPMTVCSPDTRVHQLAWNPVLASMLAVVYSNGSMALFMVDANESKAPDCCTLPPAEGITCASWSPKGKQIVTGKSNGTLTQYKPDLKEAKSMPAPPSENNSLGAKSILWISTYQFLVAFKDLSDPESRLCLYLVQGSKAGPTTYTNFDDICYSTGSSPGQFFDFYPSMEWGLILCSSSNGIELGVLGAQDKECSSWIQWCLPEFRAELPLKGNDEKFPVGLCVALNSTRQLPLEVKNPELLLPTPMPILFLMREDGLLCPFDMVNLKKDAVQLTKPVEALPAKGMRSGNVVFPKSEGSSTKKEPIPPPSLEKKAESKPPESKKDAFSFSMAPVAQTPAFGGTAPISNSPGIPKPNFGIASQPKESVKITPKLSFPTSTKSLTSDQPKTSTISTPASKTNEAHSVGGMEKRYQSAIMQEFQAFQKDLADFKKTSASFNITQIGGQEDKMSLRAQTEKMDVFCQDLAEITNSQSKEIHQLQTATLECYEWAEEARTRDIRNKDPKYQRLLKSRSLDPMSQRKLSSVEAKFMYLDQQIHEVNQSLDLQWREHLSTRNNKGGTRKVNIPSPEFIYKSILTNHQILEGQKQHLRKVAEEIKELKIRNLTVPWHHDNTSLNATAGSSKCGDLSQLTESFMEKTKLDESRATPKHGLNSSKLKGSSSPLSTFSPDKESALRQMLQNRGTVKIRSAKPQSPNESRFLKLDSSFNENLDQSIKQLLDAAKIINEPNTPKLEKERLILQLKESLATNPNSSLNISDGNILGKASPKTPSKISDAPPSNLSLQTTFGSLAGGASLTSTPKPSATPAPPSFGGPSMSKPAGKGPVPAFDIHNVSKSGSTQPITSTPNTTTNTSTMFSGLSANKETTKPQHISSLTKSDKTPSGASFFGTTVSSASNSSVSSFFGGLTASSSTTVTQPSTKPALTITPISKSIATSTVTTTTSAKSSFSFNTSSSTTGSGSVFGSTEAAKLGGSKPLVSASPNLTITTTAGGTKTSSGFSFANTTTSSSKVSSITTSTTGPAFGLGTKSVSSSQGIAGISSTSVFGGESAVKREVPKGGGDASIFGGLGTTKESGTKSTTAPSSVFGGPPNVSIGSLATTTSTTSSIFGGATTSTVKSIFGATPASTTSSSLFGGGSAVVSNSSLFGGAMTTPTTAKGSVFGGTSAPATTAPSSTSSASIFGTSTPCSESIFGGSAAKTPATSFGGTNVSSATKSIFESTTSTTTGSIFGGKVTSTAAPAFGTSTSAAPAFGTSTSAAPAFGTSTSAAPAFGTTTSAAPAFGTTTSAASAFGTSTSAAAAFGTTTSAAPAFGTTTSAASAFGTPFTSTSVFGTPSTVSSASVFGSTNATTSVFGGASSGATSVFGSNAPSSTGSVFGGTPNSGSGSIFGGATQAASPFGTSTAPTSATGGIASSFGSSLSFGNSATTSANASSPFGGGANTTTQSAGSIFGGGSSTFGSAPTSSTTSLFGGSGSTSTTGFSAFGTPATSTSTPSFGGGFATSSNQTAGTAGFGAFSSGATSTFGGGATTSPASPGGFGSRPAFGSPPAFGGAPAFGSTPAFGSPPAFGGTPAFGASGGSVFGGGNTTNAPSFGKMAQSNNIPTFGAIAQQSNNAPTFGGMGTQTGSTFGSMSQSNTGSAFGGGSTFGSSPASPGFGSGASSPSGASFSGWRG